MRSFGRFPTLLKKNKYNKKKRFLALLIDLFIYLFFLKTSKTAMLKQPKA